MCKNAVHFLLATAMFGFVQPAEAQQKGKVPRVAYLSGNLAGIPHRVEAFRQGLRELGYVEGQNIVIEWRSARRKRRRAVLAELVRLKVDVIVTAGGGPTRAAKKATSTIPIVMTQDRDPVANGFVASLARPGGNITGLSRLAPGLSGKQVEILREIVPGLSLMAVFYTSGRQIPPVLEKIELVAEALRVKVQHLDVRAGKDFESAFREAKKRRADAAVWLVPDPYYSKVMSNKILIVDDDPFNLDLLEQELTDQDYVIEKAKDGSEALRKVESFQPDLVLLDYMMPDLNGIEVLREIRNRKNDLPVIMLTAHGSIERAVEAMKEGAYDFITKPFESDHIALVVKKALERQKLKRGLDLLSEEAGQRYQLVAGESEKMKEAVRFARKAAASKTTVLLLGESGTGKEIFARAIHNWSEREAEPFIPINCVGLSKELLESELFGHEKGAFTGAHQVKKGKIELAHGGTVFLDEIGDISSELQAKLLRFLQEREFEHVGGTKPIKVDVRIVAATNRDLSEAVKEGRFREDLYHRLNVIAINLPPLRERREDILALGRYFLQRYSLETKKNIAEIAPEAEEGLLSYDWPGNVRELANVIERAVVLGVQ